MTSVANRITNMLDGLELEISGRGNDERDIRDIAEALDIELNFHGSDDVLMDMLETAVADLEGEG